MSSNEAFHPETDFDGFSHVKVFTRVIRENVKSYIGVAIDKHGDLYIIWDGEPQDSCTILRDDVFKLLYLLDGALRRCPGMLLLRAGKDHVWARHPEQRYVSVAWGDDGSLLLDKARIPISGCIVSEFTKWLTLAMPTEGSFG